MTRHLVKLALAVAAGLLPLHAAKAAPEKKDVTIGIPVKASTFLPLYIAEQEKMFAKHGINAKIVPFRGGSALVRAMIAGSVDVGVTSLAGVTVGIKAKQDLKVFYGGFNMVLFDWYAVKGIKSIKDTKGKKFGISRYGSSTDFLTRYALKANGLDPKTDVKIIQGGGSAARLAAMESGQLDVNILAPPFTMVAASRGLPRILQQADLSADYPWHVFFATGSFLKKNPETTKAVLKAFVEGVRLMKSNKKLASDVLMNATKTKVEFAGPTVDLIKDKIYEDGRLPSDKGMKTFWEIGIDAGDYKEAWPKERYWVDTFTSTYDSWKP
jgi:NitT/TauT family transport system substrate-binding protein